MLAFWFPKILSWPFAPGIFIAILAFYVPIEAWLNHGRHPGRIERALYSSFALVLVALEIWMISIDRDAAENRQAAADKAQLKGFNDTADRIDRNFAATMEGITGGTAYAVVLPTVTGGSALGFRIGLGRRSKKNTVYADDVFVLPEPAPPDASKIGGWARNMSAFSGPIEPDYRKEIRWQQNIEIPPAGEVSYRIEVYPRNRPTTETLRLRMNPKTGVREYSYEIARDGKVLETEEWRAIQRLGFTKTSEY